jgi:hypothetical protein
MYPYIDMYLTPNGGGFENGVTRHVPTALKFVSRMIGNLPSLQSHPPPSSSCQIFAPTTPTFLLLHPCGKNHDFIFNGIFSSNLN